MEDIDTSKTLIFVGTIIQIIVSIVLIIFGGIAIWNTVQDFIEGYFYIWGFRLFVIAGLVLGIIGLICVSFWRQWEEDLIANKRNLISTGIVCIFAGGLGGLLVLIGATMLPWEEEHFQAVPQSTYEQAPARPEPETVQTERPPEPQPAVSGSCPHCGAPLQASAKFCVNCGSSIEQ